MIPVKLPNVFFYIFRQPQSEGFIPRNTEIFSAFSTCNQEGFLPIKAMSRPGVSSAPCYCTKAATNIKLPRLHPKPLKWGTSFSRHRTERFFNIHTYIKQKKDRKERKSRPFTSFIHTPSECATTLWPMCPVTERLTDKTAPLLVWGQRVCTEHSRNQHHAHGSGDRWHMGFFLKSYYPPAKENTAFKISIKWKNSISAYFVFMSTHNKDLFHLIIHLVIVWDEVFPSAFKNWNLELSQALFWPWLIFDLAQGKVVKRSCMSAIQVFTFLQNQ